MTQESVPLQGVAHSCGSLETHPEAGALKINKAKLNSMPAVGHFRVVPLPGPIWVIGMAICTQICTYIYIYIYLHLLVELKVCE